jgi:hypothetical protein
MPNFVSEEHRRRWLSAMRKTWAKKSQKKDVLASGAKLGHIPKLGDASAMMVAEKANGHFDGALKFLRQQRVRAEDRITQLDKAIGALELLR